MEIVTAIKELGGVCTPYAIARYLGMEMDELYDALVDLEIGGEIEVDCGPSGEAVRLYEGATP